LVNYCHKAPHKNKFTLNQRPRVQVEANDWKDQAAVFGEDPYPLGIRAMRKTVERAIQGSLEQGMLRNPLKVEDLYFKTTLGT
jgi:hypothetical protein